MFSGELYGPFWNPKILIDNLGIPRKSTQGCTRSQSGLLVKSWWMLAACGDLLKKCLLHCSKLNIVYLCVLIYSTAFKHYKMVWGLVIFQRSTLLVIPCLGTPIRRRCNTGDLSICSSQVFSCSGNIYILHDSPSYHHTSGSSASSRHVS